MRSEAHIAHGAGVISVASPIAHILESRLNALLDQRGEDAVLGIISFGTAGSLWRYYRPGQWLVAPKLIGPNQTVLEPDLAWSMALVAALPGAQPTTLVASEEPLRDGAQKRALHALSGANAVDMESHVVARVAKERNLPFAVARVVLDPLDSRIPDAALAGLLEDGSTAILPVLNSLMKTPRDLVPLVRLALWSRVAHQALRLGRRALGARMAFPD